MTRPKDLVANASGASQQHVAVLPQPRSVHPVPQPRCRPAAPDLVTVARTNEETPSTSRPSDQGAR